MVAAVVAVGIVSREVVVGNVVIVVTAADVVVTGTVVTGTGVAVAVAKPVVITGVVGFVTYPVLTIRGLLS